MWVVVIEQADQDPKVVAFPDEEAAKAFEAEFERIAMTVWFNDPLWHNFPREAVKALTPLEAFRELHAEMAAPEISDSA